MSGEIRSFDTGATRDNDNGKLNFEGALSPSVLWAFTAYMASHSVMKDGTVRAADNWQKGFPDDVLFQCLMRHVFDLWMLHRGHDVIRPEDGHEVDWNDALGGAMFNLQAIWHKQLNDYGA